MKARKYSQPCIIFLFLVFIAFQSPISNLSYAQQSIGSVTTVKNRVQVTHVGEGSAKFVKQGDGVLFQDLYETQAESRAKLLFVDDSLLTLGEKTRLQITENVYNPAENRRSSVLNLAFGRLRLLVGKAFTGAGSKFEIHTPTAVAAARGTYLIIWIFVQNEKLATGILSLQGSVSVKNSDAKVLGTVQLEPNQFSIIAGEAPPTKAAPADAILLSDLLLSTELPDELKEAIPDEIQVPESDLISTTGGPAAPPIFPRAAAGSGIPAMPPIPQQPLSSNAAVNVEVRFP